MTYKFFLRSYINHLERTIKNCNNQINHLTKERLANTHPEIELLNIHIEEYKRCIRESQLELGILAEKGRR